jgi:2-polyprenyl-3-methyl-5-hydroxy-6-metoxy-1,4-benzoquinol methylase
VLNPVSAVNSLVAYLYRRLNQNDLDLPVNADRSPAVTCGTANTCSITDNGAVLECPDAQCATVPAGDRVAAYVTQRGNTTYVTYTTNGLPLTNLIRDFVPFGDVIADLTEPLLTEIVSSAYPNGSPIPADPSKYQPATPFSSLTHLAGIPNAIEQGLSEATGSESTTTSTTALTADDPTPTDNKKLTTADGPKPLTNVVRDSDKTVPQSAAGDDTPSPTSDPVAIVGRPTKDEAKTTESDTTAKKPEARPKAATNPDAGIVVGMAAHCDGDYWNHNAAYYPWLVAIAAEHHGDVLDVGCGDGLLAQRLAPVSRSVTGIDPDPAAVARATDRLAAHRHVTVSQQDFHEYQPGTRRFDVITFVASLHHMDLHASLIKARDLLTPTGEIAVVGCSANKTARDWVWSVMCVPAARLGSWLHSETRNIGVVVTDPQEGLDDIRRTVDDVLPRASVRRALYYRYLLRWRSQ